MSHPSKIENSPIPSPSHLRKNSLSGAGFAGICHNRNTPDNHPRSTQPFSNLLPPIENLKFDRQIENLRSWIHRKLNISDLPSTEHQKSAYSIPIPFTVTNVRSGGKSHAPDSIFKVAMGLGGFFAACMHPILHTMGSRHPVSVDFARS